MDKDSVFKPKSYVKYYIKHFVISCIVALLITLAVSLVFGFKYRIVQTDSMAPTMGVGTLVIESKVAYDDLKIGDIITYSRPNEASVRVTHRIVAMEDDTFIVKGDNAAHTQVDSVTRANYVGKVVMYIPQIKTLYDWLAANMFLLLYDIVVIVMMYQILF